AGAPGADTSIEVAQSAELDRPQGEPPAGTATEEQDRIGAGIPQILVKGSQARSLNADIERTRDDIQPYVVLNRKAIEQSGATNVNDLLRSRLTMSYMRQTNLQNPDAEGVGYGSGNDSVVSLRGLGSAQTLILIDGRRPALRNANGNTLQADLN